MNRESNRADLQEDLFRSRASLSRLTDRVFLFLILWEAAILSVNILLGTWIRDSYLVMLLCMAAGLVCVVLPNKALLREQSVFASSGEKMTPGTFLILLGLLTGLQCLASLLISLLTSLGLPPSSAGNDIGAEAGLTALIYACLLGPIAEEVIFRGFTLGLLRKGGMLPAIVISALCFGLMHMNVNQLITGFLIGLVLGWVYCRYSLFWCCVLHVFNNLILSHLFTCLNACVSDPEKAAALESLLFLVSGIISIRLAVSRLQYILPDIKESEKQRLPDSRFLPRGLLRCPWAWVCFILLAALTVLLTGML